MRRADLVPDCGRCAALCCVATSFDAGAAFAFDKAAGERCRHLRRDDRCAIHASLAARGFAGCAAYDCYGAGQRVTRAFAATARSERERNAAFLAQRVVHELLWQLTEAQKLCPASHAELRSAIAREIEALDRAAREPLAAPPERVLEERRERARWLLRDVGAALGRSPAAQPAFVASPSRDRR
ncbi:MAG TPA: hypothetical protein VFT98_18225 [Myxococcota bacterium]|nr:hypothetical protein [Myxococcota bacterium]